MKTIALFGGSGLTGQQFLTQALAAGYQVRALARDPQKIPQRSAKLEVIQGDVLDATDVAATIEGADLVVSLFGQVKGSPKDVQTRGTAHIVAAMKEAGIRRVISLSGGGLPYAEDRPKLADKLIKGIMRLVVPHVLTDAQNHADVLRQSGLAWEIVRGPRLTTEPARGQYRVGWVGVDASTSIGRADLASFILTQIEAEGFVHKMPFVSY
ncbi:NAD-dependent epimerase/dehydratase family protein [Hymenobacter lapidiphilus]|uniref:NAD(P)-dependent oxidoreductase n=1 Tax=Hymenobacter sp. CCM 8763 TaxID=2303334 RepID=UPI000E344431|nr:SDR family oxidoreductase [Hymenobacter sp. CCM 8763]RFP65353.1 NAD-dependent epimerase/dehydratase family protein [Hymenobacter sp. CCM 8763]